LFESLDEETEILFMTLLAATPEPLHIGSNETAWLPATHVVQEIKATQRKLMMRLHLLTLMLGGFGILLAALGLAPGSNARVNGQLLNAIFAVGLSLPAFLLAFLHCCCLFSAVLRLSRATHSHKSTSSYRNGHQPFTALHWHCVVVQNFPRPR